MPCQELNIGCYSQTKFSRLGVVGGMVEVVPAAAAVVVVMAAAAAVVVVVVVVVVAMAGMDLVRHDAMLWEMRSRSQPTTCLECLQRTIWLSLITVLAL
jgi:hypothetical protein